MTDSSSHGLFGQTVLRRLLLVSAILTIGTVIYFLLGDTDGLAAEDNLLPAAHAATGTPAPVLARVDGVPITEDDVVVDVAAELAALEDERRRLLESALESRIADQLIRAEATARGLSPSELLALEVDATLDLVPDAEIAARVGSAEAVEALPVESVREIRREIRLQAFVDTLREQAAVSVYGEPGS